MDDLIGEFISETSESLAALERALGEHARQPMTRDGWDMAYRLMHTIKGTCGFLRFANMEKVAGESETLLAALRDGDITPSPTQLGQLRTNMAQISFMMDYLAREGSEPELPQLPPAPAPQPAATPVQEKLSEQLHRPQPNFTMAGPSTPLATRPSVPQMEERVSYATLATLMKVRNQLKHSLGKQDANVKALETLLADLKNKLLDRPAGVAAFPRPAEVVLVACGTMRFAVEQSQVHEIVRIGAQQRPVMVEDGAMISIRGGWLPRLSLAQRLDQESSAEEAYAIVVDTDDGRVALCVEQIEGLEQLMLQAVPSLLRSCRIYHAAAILGDGSPCLLLNPQELMVKQAAPEAPPAPMEASASTVPLLLFADGTATQKAVPLKHVARVEPLPVELAHHTARGIVASCRGEELRLHVLPGCHLPTQGDVHAILLLDMPGQALVAHRMGGIVEVAITLPEFNHALVMGHHHVEGTVTDIIDPIQLVKAQVAHG